MKQERLALFVAALVLLGCALAPLVALSLEVLAEPGRWPAAAWGLFLRSVGLAAGVTLVATMVGLPLGVLLSRTDARGRVAAALLHAFPLFLPPLLPALGWSYLVSASGSEACSRLLYSSWGVVAVLGLTLAPIVTGLTALGVLGVDPALEEAARMVAPPRRVVTGILLPLARSTIVLGAGLVFSLALSEMGVPLLLRVRTYPTMVLARLGGISYAPGEAFLLAMPLAGVGLVLLALERLSARGRAPVALRLDRPAFRLGAWRGLATAACWGAAALGALPLAALLVRAGPAGLAAAPGWAGASVVHSLVTAFVAATVITGVGLVIGHARVRGDRAADLLDAIAVLTFLTPAAALGVGIIAVWNHAPTAFIYETAAILVIGFVARYAALGVRVLGVAIAAAAPHLEEAAAVMGARYSRRIVGIVAPVHRRAIGFTFALALVFCLRDLETAVLYYPPGAETLTVRIFTLEANASPSLVAGLAVVHASMTGALVALGLLLFGRRAR